MPSDMVRTSLFRSLARSYAEPVVTEKIARATSVSSRICLLPNVERHDIAYIASMSDATTETKIAVNRIFFSKLTGMLSQYGNLKS